MEKIFPECQSRLYLSLLFSLNPNQASFSVSGWVGVFFTQNIACYDVVKECRL